LTIEVKSRAVINRSVSVGEANEGNGKVNLLRRAEDCTPPPSKCRTPGSTDAGIISRGIYGLMPDKEDTYGSGAGISHERHMEEGGARDIWDGTGNGTSGWGKRWCRTH
jgi:hypothetical protein